MLKRHMGSGVTAPPFLTSVPDEGEWWASRPGSFTRGERFPGTHWIGGWLGPRVGLDDVEKGKIRHCRESNPGRPARSPRYTDWAIPTPLLLLLLLFNANLSASCMWWTDYELWTGKMFKRHSEMSRETWHFSADVWKKRHEYLATVLHLRVWWRITSHKWITEFSNSH
jgi:hypothetical protein